MRPVVLTVGPLAAASANNIALSTIPVDGSYININGAISVNGVAVMDSPRRVLITYGTETSNRTLIISGTTFSNQKAAETVTIPLGAPGTISSNLDYITVTSLLPGDGGWSQAMTVGTSTFAGSSWVCFDEWAFPQISVQLTASGTVNYTLQQTMDDPNSLTNPVLPYLVTWVNCGDTAAVGATGTIQTAYAFMPKFARILLNSGTGSVTGTFIQSAVYPQ